MDYLTKNKMLFWCVIVLVVLNAVTLGSFWWGRPRPEGPRGRGAHGEGQRILKDKLQLSEEQADQFEQIRQEHFARTKPMQEEMQRVRLELLDQVFASEREDGKTEELLAQLGGKQVEFERQLLRHFQELAEACTADQVAALKEMLTNLVGPSGPQRPGHGPGRGTGTGPGPGPGHGPGQGPGAHGPARGRRPGHGPPPPGR